MFDRKGIPQQSWTSLPKCHVVLALLPFSLVGKVFPVQSEASLCHGHGDINLSTRLPRKSYCTLHNTDLELETNSPKSRGLDGFTLLQLAKRLLEVNASNGSR